MWLISFNLAYGLTYSDNFIVFSDNPELEKTILKHAELSRESLAQTWLGNTLPPGEGKTIINVQIKSGISKGITWKKDHPDRTMHNVYITADPSYISSILEHELIHVIFATQFPLIKQDRRVTQEPFPAWIEEGIASRYDDNALQTSCKRTMDYLLSTGNWPNYSRIFESYDINCGNLSIYSCEKEAVEFLLGMPSNASSETSSIKLVKFGVDCRKLGIDTAFQKHYDIASGREFMKLLVAHIKEKYKN